MELARNAHEFFRTDGPEERPILLRFIPRGATLQDGKVIPTFKRQFDIILGVAEDARKAATHATPKPTVWAHKDR